MTRCIVLIAALLSGVAGVSMAAEFDSASSKKSASILCMNAGQEYSEGAGMCECPSMKGEGGLASGGEPGAITSRRMQCKQGQWVASDTMCVDLRFARSSGMYNDHQRLHELYCPRQGLIESAETALEKATPSQGISILTPLCKRFAIPAAVCASAIEAISKVGK